MPCLPHDDLSSWGLWLWPGWDTSKWTKRETRGWGPADPSVRVGGSRRCNVSKDSHMEGGSDALLAAGHGGLISPRPRDTCYCRTFSILAILVGGIWSLL